MYTSVQKFGVGKNCFTFLKNVSPRLHLFNQKYSKNSNIEKYNYNLKYIFYLYIF